MEQKLIAKTSSQPFLGLILLLFALVLTGCKKPISNPESLDPIFSDLNSMKNSANSLAENEKKEIETLRAQLEKMAPNDPLRKRTVREIYRREKNLVQHQQRILYFQIRAEQRKDFAREEYLRSFYAEKPWPRPEDIEAYKKQKKIADASRNWSDRVPQLKRHIKQPPPDEKDKKAAKAE